jgi:cyclophilin family peptidyl-prolyl cis-trans isomerase
MNARCQSAFVLCGALLVSTASLALGQSETTNASSKPTSKPSVAGSIASPSPVPTGPTAVIDTSKGRITCRLFEKEAPLASANFIGLAEGTKEWTDPATGTKVVGKRFYDATSLRAPAVGIIGGDRIGNGQGSAGFTFSNEVVPTLNFDVPGRLAMVSRKPNESSSQFMITKDPLPGLNGKMTIFGQCDVKSVEVVRVVIHQILTTDGDSAAPIVISRISIVRGGQPMPRVEPDPPMTAVVPKPHARPAPAVPAPEPTGPLAVIDTNMGKLTCRLFTKEAPIATGVFIGLAEGTKDWTDNKTTIVMRGKPFYDGLTFHRVVPDFLIQGGDELGGAGGGGDPGFHYENEIVPGLEFDRPGRMSIANAGPGTNDSQFCIMEHAVRRLNGGYTIIGQCDDATVKTVAAITRVPRDTEDKPLAPVVIRHISIVRDEAAKHSNN